MIREAVVKYLFRGKAPTLDTPYPEQRDNTIVSYDSSSLYSAFAGGERYNPDDLAGQRGLQIYAKMLIDEQVKSVTEFKLNAILGRGWQFKFEGQTKLSPEEQKKRIAVFNAVCQKVRGSFLDAIEGVASGREYGFSVTEKVYGQITVDGATYTGLNMLLTRDPCSFRFFTDDYGLLTKITQRTNGKADVTIDPDKVIHYVHKPNKWDRIYGRSELRAAYRAWYLKDITLKMWALHLERFGSGIPVATRTGEATLTGPEIEAFKRVMQDFKAHTSIILPPGFTAEVVFPASTDQFQKALEYHDLAIAKSQLVPNLLGLSHTGQTGAYSQSQTQFEAFFWTTSTDGKRLAECLNEQLFRDIGDQNWGDGEYPYFCFKPLTLDNAIKLLTAFKDMIGAGAAQATEDDERFLRELLELPERDPDAEPLIDPMAERQQTQAEAQAEIDNELRQQEIDQKTKQAANASRYSAPPITVTVHNPAPAPAGHQSAQLLPVVSPAAGGAAVVPHGKLRSASIEQFTRAAQRVAFSVIEKRTDDYAVSTVDTLAGLIAKATTRALGDDDNMRVLTDEDPADVAAIDLHSADRGKLKSTYRGLLMQSWTLGSNLAANEIDRARGERTELTSRRMHFVSLRDNATAYFDTQSFRMAGDTSDAVRKIIQQELQNGIKFGKSIPDIRIAIWERLLGKGLTTVKAIKGSETSEEVISALEALGLDDLDEVAPYLNTLVRTNTFEALNEARFAEFTDPIVSDFVQALEYAAVLDSSTCFAAGTLVQLSNMTKKPIELIGVGEKVVSGNGSERTVRARKVAVSSKWRRLKLETGEEIVSTPTHPFWARRSDGHRWVECREIQAGDSVATGALRPVQQAVSVLRELEAAEVLQSGVLSGGASRGMGNQTVSVVQERVHNAEDLCGSWGEPRSLLLQVLPEDAWQGRDVTGRDGVQVRDMQETVHGHPVPHKARQSHTALLQSLPAAATDSGVPALQEAVRDSSNYDAAVLLQGVLSQVRSGDEAGSDGQGAVDRTWHTVSAGSAHRPVLDRLCGCESPSNRSGRRVLALETSGDSSSSEEGCAYPIFGAFALEIDDTERDGCCEGGFAAIPNHGVVPTPTGSARVVAADDIEGLTAFCYDLEIEGDHSYLVGPGLIAHNTEICRELNGKVYRADSPEWSEFRPPNHWNCRSVLIPVTVIDGWDGQESQTPTVEPAEGFG